jgi:hypothetical protein
MSEKNDRYERAYREALHEYQAASLRVFLRRFRVFGVGFLLASVAVALLLEGMPLHAFAGTFAGPVALIIWLGFLIMTAGYGSMALGKWLLMKQK